MLPEALNVFSAYSTTRPQLLVVFLAERPQVVGDLPTISAGSPTELKLSSMESDEREPLFEIAPED